MSHIHAVIVVKVLDIKTTELNVLEIQHNILNELLKNKYEINLSPT